MKKPKAQRRAPTQDELLKRAQETEERNVIEHRDYLKAEDEKRERARLVRPVIEGGLVRWVSKVEEEVIPPPPEPPTPVASTSYGYVPAFQPSTSYTALPYTIGPGQPPHWGPITPAPISPPRGAYTNHSPYPHPSTLSYTHSPPQPYTSSTSSATRPLEPLPAIVQRKRKIAKNYVVLENAQTEKAPRVTWKQTMDGMFGDHGKWEEMKVYSTKNRPMCELVLYLVARSRFLFARRQRARERGARLRGWPRTTRIHELASRTRMYLRSRRSARSLRMTMYGTRSLGVMLGKKR